MKQLFKRKIVRLLLATGVATMAVLNLKPLIDFFLPEVNLNETVTRTIAIKNSTNQNEKVSFKIPKGFLTSHVPNEGQSINLHVSYPTKSYATQAMYSDRMQKIVSFHISARDMTVGDQFKSAIDNGTFESRYSLRVLRKEGDQFYLTESDKPQKERNDISQLFYDADRLHWVYSRLAYTSLSAGEGSIKNKPINVHYIYSTAVESDPVAMHKWAMSFVESFQVNSQQGK